jgi:transcriptional regulator with XRE-family HTH domain
LLRAQRVVRSIGLDLRAWRHAAGLTQSEVASAAGISRSLLCRLEIGRSRDVTMRTVAVLYAVVGHDVSVKGYPVGEPIRDAGQLRLLDRMRGRTHPAFRWTAEAPMPIAGDLRAWDARLDGPVSIGVEAETRLSDLQQLQRRIALKQRDSGVDRVVLLVASTHHNRDVVAAAIAALRQSLPLDTRETLWALGAGRDPGANGLVIL